MGKGLNFTTKLANNGRLTIPKKFRNQMKWSEGDELNISNHGNHVTIKKKEEVCVITHKKADVYIQGVPFSNEGLKHLKPVLEELPDHNLSMQ